MEPYNEYSLETIKNLIEAGKKIKAEGYTECEIASFEKGYNTDQYRFIRIGFLSPDFQVGEIKEYSGSENQDWIMETVITLHSISQTTEGKKVYL